MKETFNEKTVVNRDAPITSVEMLNERDRRRQDADKDPGIDWKAWASELQQRLGSLLADTADFTPAQWAKVPAEVRELIQGAIELEAEASTCLE